MPERDGKDQGDDRPKQACCLGVPWWFGLITEPLGFVQDAQDVMLLFDEWLAVLGL